MSVYIEFKIGFSALSFQCPATVIYIPNFITSEEEQQILKNVENAPKPKWVQLLNRRLMNYGGVSGQQLN